VLSDERECCPDVALLTYGAMVPHVLEAVQQLEQTGVSVRVVHLPMIDPLDESIIVEALHDAAVTVVVEDHLIRSGLYSVVCEIAVRKRIHASVHPIGLPSWFAAGRLPQVLRVNGLNGESIAQRVTAILNDEATMQRTTNGESHAS
jgi:transketolase